MAAITNLPKNDNSSLGELEKIACNYPYNSLKKINDSRYSQIRGVGYDKEKRACKRVQVDIGVTFCCCKKQCSGTIKNFSAYGMLINTKEFCIPFRSEFDVLVNFRDGNLRVPVGLHRIELSYDKGDSIGVEIINPTRSYAEFLSRICLF